MFTLSLFPKHSHIWHIFGEFIELIDYYFVMLKQLIISYVLMYCCYTVLANILQDIVLTKTN